MAPQTTRTCSIFCKGIEWDERNADKHDSIIDDYVRSQTYQPMVDGRCRCGRILLGKMKRAFHNIFFWGFFLGGTNRLKFFSAVNYGQGLQTSVVHFVKAGIASTNCVTGGQRANLVSPELKNPQTRTLSSQVYKPGDGSTIIVQGWHHPWTFCSYVSLRSASGRSGLNEATP